MRENGEFKIGGIPVSDLAEDFGSPLYVYDEGILRRQVKRLREAIDFEPFQLRYACKANGNLTILRLLRSLGVHLDIASPGELSLALRAGFEPGEILFTGNSVSNEELTFIHRHGLLVNLDSVSQLKRYGQLFPNRGVSLRINPDFGAGHHEHVITGGADSKFGISIDEIEEAVEQAARFRLRIIGLHQHIGSGILNADIFLRAMEPITSLGRRFEQLSFMSLGGGLGIPYAPQDQPLDINKLGRGMSQQLTAFCLGFGRPVRLELEPGRYLVGPCGYLLMRVNTIKRTVKHCFAGTDSGFNHLIRHPLYRSYHRILNASRADGPVVTVAVCGNLCESGDLFTHGREMVEPREGDLIAVCDVGAYGYAMSFSYNMRPRPAEILVSNGKARLIRRRETTEDLLTLFNE